MINIASAWYDTFAGTADCCAVAEYDKMTDFIQNDAVVEFRIWDDVIKSNEHFSFTQHTIEFEEDRAIYINCDETYIGHGAGDNITTGTFNSLFGNNAGNDITDGTGNSIFGSYSGALITSGDYNVLMGGLSGSATGVDIDKCVFIGYQAGQNNTQDNITAIGYKALMSNTGAGNVAVGYQVLDAACTGTYNTGVGTSALGANLGGEHNVGLGYNALAFNTTGNGNVAVGSVCLDALTTGSQNVVIGNGAGGATAVDITSCVLIGSGAGNTNTQSNIVAVGYNALNDNSGVGNTAVGNASMDAAACSGGSNAALGTSSLGANTTGTYNTSIGANSLNTASTGDSNTAVGYRALMDNVSANNNTAVGSLAGENALVAGCVYLGYDAGSDNATANTLHINNSNSAFPLIWGDFANDKLSIGNNNDEFFTHLLYENTGGVLHLKEASAAITAIVNYGAIWTEGDNLLHFMSGAGVEYTVDITPV